MRVARFGLRRGGATFPFTAFDARLRRLAISTTWPMIRYYTLPLRNILGKVSKPLIKEFIESAGEGLRADRERALLCVAYDTMARRSELVAFNLEDVEFLPNGSGTMLIRRSKTDQTGEGSRAYLAGETAKWLKIWLDNAGIREGAMFRRLVGQNRVGGEAEPGYHCGHL